MNQRISIYATPNHVSIDMANGTCRTTAGNDFPAVVAAMHPDDLVALEVFVRGMLQTLTAGREIGVGR